MSASRPPLVFIHGAWHGAWCWREFIEYFSARGYDCYTVEFSGHGATPPKFGFRFRGMGGFLADIDSDAVPFEEAILLGHSTGGLLLQRYLATRKARGAVMLAPVRYNAIPWLSIARILLDLRLDALGLLFRVHPIDADIVRRFFFLPETPNDLVQAATANITAESPFLIWRISTLGKFHFWRYAYDGQTPVMIVAGGRDYFFKPTYLEPLRDYYRADFYVDPDLPHNVMSAPGWERVAAQVESWINAH